METMEVKFDYNLIKYLIAIIETGSMAAASQVLDVAPSAVSYAVVKLRKEFNDPLFIRAQNGVSPTVLANNVYSQFKPLFFQINDNIQKIKSVDKASFERRNLVIRCSELLEIWATDLFMRNNVMMSKCLLDFRHHALSPEGRLMKLRNREVDIDIGRAIAGDHNIRTENIGSFNFVLLCRQNHPRFHHGITRKEFLREPRVGMSMSFYDSGMFSGLDVSLFSSSLEPNIRSESLINLALHALRYDLLVVCPSYIVPVLVELFSMRIIECDFIQDVMEKLVVNWNKRSEHDPFISEVVEFIVENARKE